MSKPGQETANNKNQNELPEWERLIKAGFDMKQENRSGSYLAEDQEVKHSTSLYEGVEVLSLKEAVEQYPEVKERMWTLVDKDKDEYTRLVYDYEQENELTGVFIRVKAGKKVSMPLQSCFMLKSESFAQKVHNIIIAEEGSELHIITGCTTGSYVVEGAHYGITEFFIGKNAVLSYTMIHQWAPQIRVLPRSAMVIEENGLFLSNYVSLDQVSYIQSYPTAHLNGRGAKVRFYSVVLAPKGSHLDMGARGILNAPDTSCEIISQTVSQGGKIISRGHIIGNAPGAFGHMECNGMIVKEGIVDAVPELDARLEDLSLTHEAAVGRMSQEEIDYLRSRGLTEDEARSLILTGFLSVQMEGIPPQLQKSIDDMIASMAGKSL